MSTTKTETIETAKPANGSKAAADGAARSRRTSRPGSGEDRFAHAEIRVTSVEDLKRLSTEEMARVFRDGVAPDSVRALEGSPACYPLTLTDLARIPGFNRSALALFDYMWHGKDFWSLDDQHGWGYNRISRGLILHAFPYATYIRQSKFDDKPCFVLDFDVPRNPWFERPCNDELREVAPGLFFGTSCFRILGKWRVLGYFAVDTNDQTSMTGTEAAR